jgi:carbonic anhydrase
VAPLSAVSLVRFEVRPSLEAGLTRNRRSSRTIDVVFRFDPDRPTRRRAPRTPKEAQAKLVKGNRSFAHLLDSPGSSRVIPLDPSDVGHGVLPGVAPVQRPFAAVLGCSDARVPIETVFQQRSNDLFVVRVAGNGVGSGCLGSLRYAADHFPRSLKLVVVLGHSQCGAVTSAVDVFLRPARYLPLAANYPLRSIVDAILVAVRTASLALEGVHGPQVAARPGYRAALIETAVAINACVAAFGLKQVLESRRCRVLFGTYDLASRYVRLAVTPDGRTTPSGIGLFPAPDDDDEVRRLATAVAGSASVAALLRMGGGARRR